MDDDKDKENDLVGTSFIEDKNNSNRQDSNEKKDRDNTLYYIPIGLALGTVFGEYLFGNMALGMSLGLLFGIILSLILK